MSEPEPPRVLVAWVEDSPWPELAGENCHGGEGNEPASWVVWTERDTGDGMRLACNDCLGDWVSAVYGRLVGWPEPERPDPRAAAELAALAGRLADPGRAYVGSGSRKVVSGGNESR